MRYSNDTRKIAIKLLNEDKKSLEEVSEILGIYHETLEKWQLKFEQGELFKIHKSPGKPRVYDYEKLKEFIEQNPDKYLREIKAELFEANGKKASLSGIDDALKKMNIKLKKKSFYSKKETKKKE